jgi:D-3-phosphoglycerate dehydrogenase
MSRTVNTSFTSYPKDKINVLLLENINSSARELFRKNGYSQIQSISKALTEDELVQAVKNVHLLGIRSKTTITQRVLEQATRLQAIGCFCIGVNQVNLKEATKKGIVVFNAPYSNTRSVAELVLGLCIMLIRRIPDKNAAAHAGIWLKESTGSYELRGKTLGIIGYGNIGSQLSIMAESMGMKVRFYDTETKLPLGNASAATNLKDLLKESDIISLHVPETSSTKNLINKTTLKYFKKGALLINYARGQVVDTEALAKSIQDGYIGGAAIDVFPHEPERNGDKFASPLQGLNNVILTPHIGGSTEEAQESIGQDVSHKLFQYLEKGITIGSHTVPALSLPPVAGAHRILHIHKNVPGVLGEINTQLSHHNINIVGQYLKTNDDIGYVVLDIDHTLSKKAMEVLKEVKQTIKLRILY